MRRPVAGFLFIFAAVTAAAGMFSHMAMDKIEVENSASTEEETQTFVTLDESGLYRGKPLDSLKSETTDFLDCFFNDFYTFSPDTDLDVFTEKADCYFDKEQDDYDIVTYYNKNQERKTESRYLGDFTYASFVVEDKSITTVKADVLTDVHMSDEKLPEGDYSILVEITLERHEGDWVITSYSPSVIYVLGTTNIGKSKYDGCVNIDGEKAGMYHEEKETETDAASDIDNSTLSDRGDESDLDSVTAK